MSKQGKVKFVKNVFGFIEADSKEYFFPFGNVQEPKEASELKVGDHVTFDVRHQPNQKNDMALNIQRIQDPLYQYLKTTVPKLKEADYDKFCDNVRTYAKDLSDGDLKTAMIRRIYSRVMNSRNVRELKVLRPHFAYLAGRNEKKDGVVKLMDLLDYLAKKIETEEELGNIKQFMEAVVAYNRYFSGE